MAPDTFLTPVVDTAGCLDLYELPEFAGKLAGREAAWVREGQIVRTSGHRYHPECFESYTRQLLPECMDESIHTAEARQCPQGTLIVGRVLPSLLAFSSIAVKRF